MAELFLYVFNMSVAAGWLVPAVFVLRWLLKRAPKRLHVLLWIMVALRMLLPDFIPTPFSLIPSAEIVSPEIMMDPTPSVNTGIPVINEVINPIFSQNFTPAPGASANPLQIWIPVAAIFWFCGIASLLIYGVVSYLRLRHRLREAVVYRDNIYQSQAAGTAFVLGFRKPRIYLPFSINEADLCYVIAHEQAHIARMDHWWKPLGFLLLSIHWFNPLLWWGYSLFCRDIELACDERVITNLTPQQRADYSQALLSCSVKRQKLGACPLAFGEVEIKKRIQSVLRYKKPSLILLIAAVILCAIAAVCLLTNPGQSSDYGIRDIRVVQNGSDTVLELDYYPLEKSGFLSRDVLPDEGEYSGDGLTDYDGALGKYRMLIAFGDTKPTVDFRKRYPGGEVHSLPNPSTGFDGNLKFKVVYPADHGCYIYIGCDKPFTHKSAVVRNNNYLWGTLHFKLFREAEPDSTLEQSRIQPGMYRPNQCIYKNPNRTNFVSEQLENAVYHLKEVGFSIIAADSALMANYPQTDRSKTYRWQPTTAAYISASLYPFSEGQAFFESVGKDGLYRDMINEMYTLIKAVSGTEDRYYLIYATEGQVYCLYQIQWVSG